MQVKVSEQSNYTQLRLNAVMQRRLHLVGGEMMLRHTVGMSHHRVILIKAPHAVHFIVDAAGDVLNVLHMGPDE